MILTDKRPAGVLTEAKNGSAAGFTGVLQDAQNSGQKRGKVVNYKYMCADRNAMHRIM